MLASWALSATVQAGPEPEPPPRHPILTSILPALETAFGVEHPALFPEAIAALVERLTERLNTVPDETEFASVVFLEAA
ncbi:hypothetical protein [Methylobacterium sp. J-076]|uniref:hypothetical protein n=1 Tax=Methylobacterium sp. J-076 TaxID=2836655 RepID=UPI001FBB37EF|nr:hypothetical protein [Methylobacterium sp. J-076]MCJ2015734.1 hypothetical protein [Methylobacterium sp. J-076]